MLFASHFWAMPEAGVFVKSNLSLLSKVPEGGVGLAETVQTWLGGAGSVEQIWVVELGETVEEMTHDYKSHPLDPSKSLEYHRILTNSVQPTKQSHLIRLHVPLTALASLCMWAVLKPSRHEKLTRSAGAKERIRVEDSEAWPDNRLGRNDWVAEWILAKSLGRDRV